MGTRLQVFETKIEEYYLSCMPSIEAMPDKSFLKEWPFYKFSIVRLHAALGMTLEDPSIQASVGEKLIDIKLHYAYLLTAFDQFYRGVALIVGNNEIEKLNPNTISVLRGIHYRVYLLSVLVEQILDMLYLILTGQIYNGKKGKWKKIIELVQVETAMNIITIEDANLLLTFKDQYRTAEMHKFSMVRALTGKDKWTHLQEEELAAGRTLQRLFAFYVPAVTVATDGKLPAGT